MPPIPRLEQPRCSTITARRLAYASTAIMLMMAWMTLTGCQTSKHFEMVQTHQPVKTPAQTSPIEDATLAHIQGSDDSWARMMSEMDRTCRATEWSLMSITRFPPTESKAHPTPPNWFKARARMLNGATAQIICWPEDKNTIAVAVRAGLFGESSVEARFIKNLAASLGKHPVPDRSMTFDMPTLENYQQLDSQK